MEQTPARNYYADHLAAVNKFNSVITTQDICNNFGSLIVSEGTYITEAVANKLADFELSEPIELQVELATAITPNQLFKDILFTVTSAFGPDGSSAAKKKLIRHCYELDAHPLIFQKLTVFADRMPERYGATQGASGFAILIGLQLGLNDEAMDIVFAATQMHEVGLLSIAPELAAVIDRLPYGERRALFNQQLAAGKDFLDRVPNLSKRVYRVILEHRDLVDGSGVPQSQIDIKHSVESQVVGLAVMLQEAYAKRLKPRGYGTQHLLPIIQMEANYLDLAVYNAAVHVLQEMAHGNARVIPLEFMPNLAKYLAVLQRFLIHWIELAKTCAMAIEARQSNLMTKRSIAIITGLEELIRNSGLLGSDIRSWLEDTATKEDDNEFAEVEIVALMFESIHAKLKCLQRSMLEGAQHLGREWVDRCDDLATLLYSMPKDYFEAIEKQPYFNDGRR